MQSILGRLASREVGIMVESEYLVSAVLLPLVDKEEGLHILFEVRAENLEIQPGEICFPGGRVEPAERKQPWQTAIRETAEELGITPQEIEVLAPLDILPTPQGRLVYPYVGRIKVDRLEPNPNEVAEVFTVPVEFFRTTAPRVARAEVTTRYSPDFPFHRVPAAYRQGWKNSWPLSVLYFEYDRYFIWGMTAKILNHFITICWPDGQGNSY